MTCGFVVCKCVGRIVAAAANVTANEANPKVLGSSADRAVIVRGITIKSTVRGESVILSVSANWAARTPPLLQTSAVEDMLTEDCEEASCLIHPFEAKQDM
jgi:hypothetical protein